MEALIFASRSRHERKKNVWLMVRLHHDVDVGHRVGAAVHQCGEFRGQDLNFRTIFNFYCGSFWDFMTSVYY